jgi:hypothetical protein
MDPKLTWKAHVTRTARQGIAACEALSRITASTWGPSSDKARLLYSSVVRPILTYGAQLWSTREAGLAQAKGLAESVGKVQNKCLRRALGAYRRAPTASLEREVGILPIDLHLQQLSETYALRTRAAYF